MPALDAPLHRENGRFDGLTGVAAKESGIDYPSKLPSRWLAIYGKRYAYFHAMHSAVDRFAFAAWEPEKQFQSPFRTALLFRAGP